jgi:hypothetical protein
MLFRSIMIPESCGTGGQLRRGKNGRRLTAPANDFFANSIVLYGTNVVFGGNVMAATRESGEPRIAETAMQRTLWWQWTAPGAGTAFVRSRDTNTAPLVGAFRRGLFNQLESITNSATIWGNNYFQFWHARPELQWDTRAGETYEIVLDRFPDFPAENESSMELTWLPAPVNDDFENAELLSGNDLSIPVSNVSATHADGEPVLADLSGAKSIWFAWRAPQSGILQVTTNEPERFTNPSFQPWITPGEINRSEIIEVSPCGDLWDLRPTPSFVPIWGLFESIGPDASALGSAEITLWADVVAHTEYKILLGGKDSSAGETRLNLLFTPAPENDQFTNRIILPEGAAQVTGRTFAASADPSEPSYFVEEQVTKRSVWWEWKAPSAGRWVMRITEGVWSNVFAVYRADGLMPGTEIGYTATEPLSFTTSAGETLRIGVFALSEWGSSVGFALNEATPPSLAVGQIVQINEMSQYIQFNIGDSGGLNYVLETSTNLTEWLPIRTNQTVQPISFGTNLNSDSPFRFFRTRLAP